MPTNFPKPAWQRPAGLKGFFYEMIEAWIRVHGLIAEQHARRWR